MITSKHPSGGDRGFTQTITLRPKPEALPELERLADEWNRSNAQVAGHLGTGIYRSVPPTKPEIRIVSQFEAESDLQAWDAAEAQQALVARAGSLCPEAPRIHTEAGVDGWFEPMLAKNHAPMTPLYMTVMMFLGMFPVSIAVHHALNRFPELLGLPALLNAAILTAVVTIITVNIAMPVLSFLYGRLHHMFGGAAAATK
jgi:antibiotic biosynthesis monooxygenase (ABM) superfamily enzyme